MVQVEWLGAMLIALVALEQKDWDPHLPFLTAAYQASSLSATGVSPNFLMFGLEITLPADVMTP